MKYIGLFFIFFLGINIHAQDNADIVKSFDSLVDSGNNYQEYKVIKKAEINAFKKELTSNRDDLNSKIKSLEEQIVNFENEIRDVKDQNLSLTKELDDLKTTKNEINFIGIKMSKSSYSMMVWIIILVLLLALAFFIIKYRNRNIVTQELKDNLKRTDKEFEEYKHIAIEKQQKLGRELLDVQKKVQTKNRKN